MNYKTILPILSLGLLPLLGVACSSESSGGNIVGGKPSSSSAAAEEKPTEPPKPVAKPIDYSKAVAMSKKLAEGPGINFGNTFDATCEECWGAGPVEEPQVELVAKLGFKTARLPVRWDEETSKEAPYTINPAYITRIKEVLGFFKKNGMRVVMNMHHHDSFIYDLVYPEEAATCNAKAPEKRKGGICDSFVKKAKVNEERLEYNLTRVDSIWSQVAREFKDFDNDFLAFELFNEPVYGVNNEIHNTMIKRTYPLIRATNPGRTLIYNTYAWGSYGGIKNLELPENDGNVIIDVHYYEPSSFTHQGHNGTACNEAAPVKWDASKSNVAAITDAFNSMRNSANTRFPATNPEGIPITIGEFGVATCNNVGSKAAWVKEVVKAANAHAMSWQYWAFTYTGGFEIYDKDKNLWETDVLAALGIDITKLK